MWKKDPKNKMSSNVQVPEGYTQEKLFITLKQHRAIQVMQSGIIRINNNLISNTYNQTFSNIQIFSSADKNRYLIKTIMQKVHTLSDINDMRAKSNYKLSFVDVINLLDLDSNDFEITNFTCKGVKNRTLFFTQKKVDRIYDCPNYVIID